MTRTGRCRASRDSARSLVTRSATTTAPAVVQNSRRSAALAIFFFRFALDAQPGVRQRVESLEADLVAALLALAEFLRRLKQPPQRLVHVPEVAPLLRGEQERLLALHGVGALIGHMKRVAREVPIGRLQARVEGLVVVAELLHHPGALLVEALLEVGQLFLIQAALGRLGFGFGLGFRRHYRVPPFRPSCRRSAIVTRRASMSTSRVTSASSSTVPSTSLRASVSPSTNPWNADTAATISGAPATLSSMRVVYSYPASLRRRWTRFTSSRARPSWIRSSVSRGSTAATYECLQLFRGELGHCGGGPGRVLPVTLAQAAVFRFPLQPHQFVVRARHFDRLGVHFSGQDI